MLALTQNEPFKFTINNLKTIADSQDPHLIENHIKSTLKTVNEVTNLKESLKLLVDFQSFVRLHKIAVRLLPVLIADSAHKKDVNIEGDMGSSPEKSADKNRSLVLNHIKHNDLTPSTKKSRVLSSHTIPDLIEELIESLQKFDQLKQNSQRIKYLTFKLYDGMSKNIRNEDIQETYTLENTQIDEDIAVELLWQEISKVKLQNVHEKLSKVIRSEEHMGLFYQLLQHVENIHKSVQNIKSTMSDIQILYEPESIDEQDNQSRDSYQLQAVTKKSNNPSEQRSLLTEMLKDSSQQSNIELPSQNQDTTQIVLRNRLKFKEYSQNQNEAHLDSQFKFSYKSAKFNPKSYNKGIKSEMSYYQEGNEQNVFVSEKIVRRKQVRIKRSEMGCSKCEIF